MCNGSNEQLNTMEVLQDLRDCIEEICKYGDKGKNNWDWQAEIEQADELIKQLQSQQRDANGLELLHPDSQQLLKACFEQLRVKMIKNQEKYGYLNEWLKNDWEEECREELKRHLDKGDPRDVAIYAMFMIYRGWITNKLPINPQKSDININELIKYLTGIKETNISEEVRDIYDIVIEDVKKFKK